MKCPQNHGSSGWPAPKQAGRSSFIANGLRRQGRDAVVKERTCMRLRACFGGGPRGPSAPKFLGGIERLAPKLPKHVGKGFRPLPMDFFHVREG